MAKANEGDFPLISYKQKVKSNKYNLKFKSNLRDRCFRLSLQVIALTDRLLKKRSAWIIGDEVVRSVCSIGANLTEALGSSTRVEFKRYYEIALKSANESKYWLELLLHSKLVESKQINPILDELQEITSMVASGVLKLKGQKL